jgi:RNA polymerase sigma-70 factor (ECF subfamily)
MLEDRLLVWKFNRGKVRVLHRIYIKYKDDMMTFAAALLYDKASAEDAVHDVFTAFIRSCGKLKLTENLKGYLIVSVANNVRNRNKASQKKQTIPLDQAASVATNSNRPDFSAIFGERSKSLAWAISQIPDAQREVLLLRLYSGLKFKAIAKLKNESINTIQGRYRYGLDKLRLLLNSEAEK